MENIETLEKKLSQCRKAGKEKVEILNQLSRAHLNLSPHKALDYGKQALELTIKLKSKKDTADSTDNIGRIYYYLDDYDKSIEYFINSLKIREKIGNKKGICQSYNNIGVVYLNIPNYDKALEYFQNSLKISEEISDTEIRAKNFINIGIVYMQLKNYNKSLEYYQNALTIYKESDNKKDIAGCLNNLGINYWYLNNFNKSLEYYLKALKLKEEIGDKWGVSNTSLNIGMIYVKLLNYDKASLYFSNGLKLAEEIESRHLLKDSYINFSELYTAKEDYQKALEYYKLYTEVKDSIFTKENSDKIAEIQTKYDTEKKEKEAEIYRLKNVELVKANSAIKKKNEELNAHREHIKLINKIIRHDLINDLAVIKSALNLYKKNNDKEVLEEAFSRINRSIELINTMRQLESFIPTHQELRLYEISDVLKGIIVKYSSIDFNIKGSGKVHADNTLISVIDNIIGNAVIHGKTEKIDIRIKEKKDLCELRIADYGNGIPDKIKKKIFDKDFVYGKTGHTGLGLYIVKKAMAYYGGNIGVEDNQPKGTVFILTFMKVG
jgi:signal transduction histidine kinase